MCVRRGLIFWDFPDGAVSDVMGLRGDGDGDVQAPLFWLLWQSIAVPRYSRWAGLGWAGLSDWIGDCPEVVFYGMEWDGIPNTY